MARKIDEVKIIIPEKQALVDLLGHQDKNLRYIEDRFSSDIFVLGNEITIKGNPGEIKAIEKLFQEVIEILDKGGEINQDNLEYIIGEVKKDTKAKPSEIFSYSILSSKGKSFGPKTEGQRQYVEAIKNNTIVFAIGPAGTGKTYLAMAMAVASLKNKEVERLILVRPAVEAGEKLGYLPGTLYEKIDPYLRPLYDALYEMMETEKFHHYMEQGTIEVAPLAYMRGRTLNDSFIVLDEAQNTSPEQMKMFLTRLGFGSKAVITGDVTQIDLPEGKYSGLNIVQKILKGIKGVEFVYFDARDVVRHKLVQQIVEAYKRFDQEKESRQK